MKLWPIFIFLFSVVQSSNAELFVGKGATGASFLKIPVSARGTALGGSFTAGRGDIMSLEYNPAGLSHIYRPDANATLIKYLEDSSLQSVSIGLPLEQNDQQKSSLQIRDEDHKTVFLGFRYHQFRAEDTGRTELGLKTDDFSIKDQLIQAGAAYSPVSKTTIGAAIKIIKSAIADKSASTFALDVGTLFQMEPPLTFGASILNIGQGLTLGSSKDELPTTVRVGANYERSPITLLGDLSLGRDNIPRESIGAEWNAAKGFFLRGGLAHHTSFDVTGGFGIRLSLPNFQLTEASADIRPNSYPFRSTDVGLDYSFQTHSELGLSHNFTLKLMF